VGKRQWLREELEEMVRTWRSSAAGLQREIDGGVALRQSLESKESRVQVLESNADELERCVNRHFSKD